MISKNEDIFAKIVGYLFPTWLFIGTFYIVMSLFSVAATVLAWFLSWLLLWQILFGD